MERQIGVLEEAARQPVHSRIEDLPPATAAAGGVLESGQFNRCGTTGAVCARAVSVSPVSKIAQA